MVRALTRKSAWENKGAPPVRHACRLCPELMLWSHSQGIIIVSCFTELQDIGKESHHKLF